MRVCDRHRDREAAIQLERADTHERWDLCADCLAAFEVFLRREEQSPEPVKVHRGWPKGKSRKAA